jgi:ribonuclease Z
LSVAAIALRGAGCAVVFQKQIGTLLLHEDPQPKPVNLLEQEFNHKNMPNTGPAMRDILNYHIVPPMPYRYAYPAFPGDAAKHYANPITVGEDGMLFSLPADGTSIHQQKLF